MSQPPNSWHLPKRTESSGPDRDRYILLTAALFTTGSGGGNASAREWISKMWSIQTLFIMLQP